jgi:hypothetical protein
MRSSSNISIIQSNAYWSNDAAPQTVKIPKHSSAMHVKLNKHSVNFIKFKSTKLSIFSRLRNRQSMISVKTHSNVKQTHTTPTTQPSSLQSLKSRIREVFQTCRAFNLIHTIQAYKAFNDSSD